MYTFDSVAPLRGLQLYKTRPLASQNLIIAFTTLTAHVPWYDLVQESEFLWIVNAPSGWAAILAAAWRVAAHLGVLEL